MALPILLLHGFTQTGAAWDGVRERLEPLGVPVLAPDLLGHGAMSDRRPVSFDAQLAHLAALAPARFALAGYSMGGRLALLLALRHPERVAALVLIGATAGIADAGERERRRAEDERRAAALERDGLESFARGWAAQPLFADQPPAVAARAHADRMRNTAAGLAAALRGLGTGAMEPVWERLGELRMPVLAAAGERDARYRELAGRLAAGVPRGRAVTIPGAGHAAHLERPAAVADLIAEALSLSGVRVPALDRPAGA